MEKILFQEPVVELHSFYVKIYKLNLLLVLIWKFD